jgi:predicted TIM-barrel fold metal-dependent hydrolase
VTIDTASDTERQSGVVSGQDRYMVVSIDSHVSPTFDQLRQYCPVQNLEQWDEWSAMWLGLWGDERNWYGERSPIAGAWQFPFTDEVRARTGDLVQRAGDGVHDPHARIRDMDADGIAAEMLYHTAFTREVLPFQGGTVPGDETRELEKVGFQMYNRWLAGFVSVDPNRFIGAAYLPIWDVEASVAEVAFARDNGIKALNFPAPHRSFPGYNDPVYEPFWAACTEADITLTTHGGAGDMPPYAGKEAWALYCSDLFYYSRRGFAYMVWGGVFERHPKLRLAFTEQRSTWVGETLADLDSIYYSSFQDLKQLIPRPPSEYFREHCWLGVSFMSRFEAERRSEIGVDRLMWGSDYPHFEGTWGYTDLSLRNTFAGIPVDEVRSMLGENAVNLFGLNRAALREIADAIGPAPEDIDRPVAEVPDIPGCAFRTRGAWS